MFGFSRETEVPQIMQMKAVVNSPMTHVDGSDPSVILAMSCVNAVTIDPTARGQAGDEMAFPFFYDKYTIVAFGYINQDSTPFQQVAEVKVHPLTMFKTGDSYYTTVPSWLAIPFTMWTGSLRYRVLVFSHSSIKGEMDIYYTPLGSHLSSGIDYSSQIATQRIDLSASSCTDFVIPWSQQTPAMAIGNNNDLGNGWLSFVARSPLVSVNPSNYVTIIVLTTIGDDFQVGGPLNSRTFDADSSYDMQFRYEVQGHVDEECLEVSGDFVPRPPPSRAVELVFGEKFESVRAYMQKFSPYLYLPVTGQVPIVSFLKYPPPPCTVTSWNNNGSHTPSNQTLVPFTFFGWFCSPYLGVSGGMRFKFIAGMPNYARGGFSGTGGIAYQGVYPNVSDYEPFLANPTNVGAEFQVPHNNFQTFVNYQLQDITTSATSQLVEVHTSVTGTYHVAAGSDFMVTQFCNTPVIVINPPPS